MKSSLLRSTASNVSVTAPARVHMGFLDLNGALGRRFGGLGLALEQPSTRVRIAPAARITARGADAARAERYARTVVDALGLGVGADIVVERAIPAHAGLGSGTQMALAVGMGLARLYELDLTPSAVAAMLGRGARSGIGVGVFEHGGFVVDGGRGDLDEPPPLICRLEFPADWRVLLILDHRRRGFNGAAEKQAFADLPPFPAGAAAHLCRLVLMQALPALAEADARRFGAAIGELQRRIGDYFAPVQGGRFASPAVARVLEWLATRNIDGLGQSSWGPTGFALCESAALAAELEADARERWGHEQHLSFAICKPRNVAGEIELETLQPQRNYTVG